MPGPFDKALDIEGGKIKSPKTAKRNEYNKSNLNKAETALLMLYLRDNGVFIKETSNKLLAECFGKLTGFEGEQLRQTISGTAQSNKDEVTDNKEYYGNLITLLSTMLDKIKQDRDKLN
jgi:hypothetical protein